MIELAPPVKLAAFAAILASSFTLAVFVGGSVRDLRVDPTTEHTPAEHTPATATTMADM